MKKTMKTICVVLLSAMVMSSMTACAERTIVVAQDDAPDVATKENVTIDWDQVLSDCEDTLNETDYPQGSYLDYAVDEDSKTIRLIWPLKNTANQLESLDYGKAYIKAFNDAVATQNFKYAFSTEDYYGGLWDEYNLELEVYKEGVILWPDEYYVNQAMDAGSNDPVIPQIIGTSSDEESSDTEETSADSTEIIINQVNGQGESTSE